MSNEKPLWANVVPLVQHYGDSCGITSVAVACNALVNTHLTDIDVKKAFGYGLLAALNFYCANKYKWMDYGNLHHTLWPNLEHKTRNGFPFIIGLNGKFSITGNGHIVCVFRIEGETVYYPDSAEAPGHIKTTTKTEMENCPPHPDGKFIYACDKIVPKK